MFLSGFAEAADGFVNPAIEGGETRVDAGQVGAAAADAEADDAHLEPLTVFGAHQRSTSVTLQKFNPNPNESANQITTIKKKKKKKRKKKTYVAGVSSFCAGADGRLRKDKVGPELRP